MTVGNYQPSERRSLSFNDEVAIEMMLNQDLPEYKRDFLEFVKTKKLFNMTVMSILSRIMTNEKVTQDCIRLAKNSQIADEIAEREEQRQRDEKADSILKEHGFFRKIKCRSLNSYEKEQRLLYDFDCSKR